jgi:hypothetical protein
VLGREVHKWAWIIWLLWTDYAFGVGPYNLLLCQIDSQSKVRQTWVFGFLSLRAIFFNPIKKKMFVLKLLNPI